MGLFLKNPTKISVLLVAVILSALLIITTAFAQEGDENELIEEGARIFAENCAVCHGEDGQGRIGANLAKDWPSIRPDLQIKETIERGVEGTLMPAWGQLYGGPLDDRQIDAVTAYILSWESGGLRLIYPLPTADTRIILTPPPGVSGDPNRGAQLYAQNCAVCHGSQGQGRIGANLAQNWPSIRPDLRVKTVIENGVEGSVMPAWSQVNGGPLSDQEINDIVAFVLTWSDSGTISGTQETASGPLTGWPVWLLFIGGFILVIIAIVYYSRQRTSTD